LGGLWGRYIRKYLGASPPIFGYSSLSESPQDSPVLDPSNWLKIRPALWAAEQTIN
jgi:hypothetical protein